MACAIEDAGFEVRDMLSWLYGSGFPKSHDVSKGIDRAAPRAGMFEPFAKHYAERRKSTSLTHNAICAAGGFFAEHNHGGASTNWEKGHNVPTVAQWAILQPLLRLSDEWLPLIERVEAEREKIGERKSGDPVAWYGEATRGDGLVDITAPATAAAQEWQGWGTALKPACEPICFGRKPLIGTVAQNVLQHGTGAINIDGCRVEAPEGLTSGGRPSGANNPCFMSKAEDPRTERGSGHASGRWPANIIHDGSEEVIAAFPDATSGGRNIAAGTVGSPGWREAEGRECSVVRTSDYARDGDGGSAARFFYTAKADADDRLGSKHPTVKPVDLMQWLCRLVTPKGGTVLDPFAGTGTTGEAAFREGFKAVLIEREEEYQADIRRRMALVLAGPDERARESIKAKTKDQPVDHGPLFAGAAE
jgi:hypothetical protein